MTTVARDSSSGVGAGGGPALVHSSQYDISFFGLERLHPFDSRKYSRTWAALREEFGRVVLARHHAAPPAPATHDELRTVHADAYLNESLRSPAYLARALEVPPVARLPRWVTDWRVLRSM